ncbi:hypothetical protein LAM19_24045, partial [Mycobacterium tuberculosis]|nr:hypothetical protein [Mycobacterium tuberculosis]
QCLAFQRLTITSNKRLPKNFRKICTAGVVIGNELLCELDVRNLMICDMMITGFQTSHRWGTYYTFMCGFRDCYFSRGYNGME